MRGILRISFTVVQRTFIEPESITVQPFQDRFRVVSSTFEFVTSRKPPSDLLYLHEPNTPAGVLKKAAIHILPESVPELNKRQKITAVTRQLQANYEKAFRKCQGPKEIFHLQRKIRSEIRAKLSYIGCISGKYKHLLTFKSMVELAAERTQHEYEKNGVFVDKLNEKIYPSGKVWMPTNERYLADYCKILTSISAGQSPSMLDIGCGSGVLSFLFAKASKKSRVFAFDKNADAVRTCNLNAARMQLRNIEAFEFDVKDEKEFQIKTMGVRPLKQFDWIVINPPWLSASRLEGDSGLGDAVYDEGSLMLQNSIRLAKRLLAKDGRIVVILSDLSNLLGLVNKTLEEMCQQSGLLVEQKLQQPFIEEMPRKSALQEFKAKARILTYVLRAS